MIEKVRKTRKKLATYSQNLPIIGKNNVIIYDGPVGYIGQYTTSGFLIHNEPQGGELCI